MGCNLWYGPSKGDRIKSLSWGLSNMPADTLSQVSPFGSQWNSDYFVGREDDLRAFARNLGGLKRGLQSHVLVAGVHGTGKSFFLHKLTETAQAAHCIGVVVDCLESTSA